MSFLYASLCTLALFVTNLRAASFHQDRVRPSVPPSSPPAANTLRKTWSWKIVNGTGHSPSGSLLLSFVPPSYTLRPRPPNQSPPTPPIPMIHTYPWPRVPPPTVVRSAVLEVLEANDQWVDEVVEAIGDTAAPSVRKIRSAR